jgi:hypothetical protein
MSEVLALPAALAGADTVVPGTLAGVGGGGVGSSLQEAIRSTVKDSARLMQVILGSSAKFSQSAR